MKALAAAALGLHWSDIMGVLCELMLWLHYSSVTVLLWSLLWLLSQPGERLCCGCRASQERINVSAVPMAPCVFFQPLSLPTLGSVNSGNSKTIGITNGISNTVNLLVSASPGSMLLWLTFFIWRGCASCKNNLEMCVRGLCLSGNWQFGDSVMWQNYSLNCYQCLSPTATLCFCIFTFPTH